MKTYKITYFMYPYKDIETYFTAKDEDEAIALAKSFRNDPFSVERVMYNTKENSEHYFGKIWLHGGNVCADVGTDELKVLAYVPELANGTDNKQGIVKRVLINNGWNPAEWL